jgi:hypothetical protein
MQLLVARNDDLYQELRLWMRDLSANESQHSPDDPTPFPD